MYIPKYLTEMIYLILLRNYIVHYCLQNISFISDLDILIKSLKELERLKSSTAEVQYLPLSSIQHICRNISTCKCILKHLYHCNYQLVLIMLNYSTNNVKL